MVLLVSPDAGLLAAVRRKVEADAYLRSERGRIHYRLIKETEVS